ncbi:DEAD/DEAH box helicase [Pelobium manganitolerans]|nr:DEAD/DEAH box helicase [Pelobium manganitolerans]
MSLLEQTKLSKQLQSAMIRNGYTGATELQQILWPRLHGGQDIVALGPEGCGKTTTAVLAALNKIKYTEEIAPQILYLVPDIESGEAVIDLFHQFNYRHGLRILGVFADGSSLDQQVLELTDGVDVVVATPDRARAVYLKLGLNLNKISFFVIDDVEEIVKKGLTLPTSELARGIKKSQFLVCSTVLHDRIENLFEQFMPLANIIEVEDLGENELNTTEQLLYHVPNFGTKLYLAHLLMADAEVFEKVLIFTNSQYTAQTVFNNLSKDYDDAVKLLQATETGGTMAEQLNSFKLSPKQRALIIANETVEDVDVSTFPSIIHFDIPEQEETYLQRVTILNAQQQEQLSIIFCTDLELSQIKKLEQAQGKKMQLMELPEDLYIVKDKPKASEGNDERKK